MQRAAGRPRLPHPLQQQAHGAGIDLGEATQVDGHVGCAELSAALLEHGLHVVHGDRAAHAEVRAPALDHRGGRAHFFAPTAGAAAFAVLRSFRLLISPSIPPLRTSSVKVER